MASPHPIILQHLPQIQLLCRRYGVARLDLFGSATGNDFNVQKSDLDLIVRFQPMTPRQHVDSYFGLADELERLFARRVDLLEEGPITNPYMLHAVEQSRVQLYAA